MKRRADRERGGWWEGEGGRELGGGREVGREGEIDL